MIHKAATALHPTNWTPKETEPRLTNKVGISPLLYALNVVVDELLNVCTAQKTSEEH